VSTLRDEENVTPKDLALVLESAKELEKADVVSGVLLRSLMKAKYLAEPKGHFGLATKFYCHFTSPIRRYPDLGVHRIVKAFLRGETDKSSVSRLSKYAERNATESSQNELRALYAEREIDELYKTIYMGDFLGEEFDGAICSVTSFGFFVRLENLCEGLVPIESLGAPFYFDETSLTLSSGRKTFALGQKVRIRVKEANIITRRVTFVLVSSEESEALGYKPIVVKKKPSDKKPHGSTKGKKQSYRNKNGKKGGKRKRGSYRR
jgi:ribonuclease R